jgi:hypothetical protein
MELLGRIVSALHTLSASVALDDVIGLVRSQISMGVPHISDDLMPFPTAILAYTSHIFCLRRPVCCRIKRCQRQLRHTRRLT